MIRALLIVGIAATPAASATCVLPSGATPQLANRTDAERWTFVTARLQDDRRKAEWWTGLWGGAFMLATMTPIALLPAAQTFGDRIDLGAAALSAGVGVGLLVVTPLPVLDVPSFPAAGSCDDLSRAERLLFESADNEAFGKSAVMHALNAGFSVALGLVLGLVYGRWVSAVVNGISTFVAGEALLLTQPDGSVRALDSYRRGDWPSPSGPLMTTSLAW